jgi:deoxyhypusine monooxygenase
MSRYTTALERYSPSRLSKAKKPSVLSQKVPLVFLTATAGLVIDSHHAGFQDPSALLKHELAYCLGQMKNAAALPILESVLANDREDPMVRHEVGCLFPVSSHRRSFSFMGFHIAHQAAEAMGAISLTASLPILKKYLSDSNRTVRETCDIAIAKVEWDHSEEGQRQLASMTTEPQFAAVSAFCVPLPH